MDNGSSNDQLHAAVASLSTDFEICRKLGDGSFGTVHLAVAKTGQMKHELIAIKTLKVQCQLRAEDLRMRESNALQHISKHEGIINVFRTFIDRNKNVHILMEYMDCNLYQLMKSRAGRQFSVPTVREMLRQILSGIEHIHRCGYMHRDIKPENILIKNKALNQGASCPYTLKIADFGLARPLHSSAPFTEYVSTRWYRAPELLLRTRRYDSAVDMYAFGCIAYELAMLRPLFPGRNELDQLNRMCKILGNPTRPNCNKVHEWQMAGMLASKLGFAFPDYLPYPIENLLPDEWHGAHSKMITELLAWNPNLRPSAKLCILRYFSNGNEIIESTISPSSPARYTSLSERTLRDSLDSKKSSSRKHSKTANWFRRNLHGLTHALKKSLHEGRSYHEGKHAEKHHFFSHKPSHNTSKTHSLSTPLKHNFGHSGTISTNTTNTTNTSFNQSKPGSIIQPKRQPMKLQTKDTQKCLADSRKSEDITDLSNTYWHQDDSLPKSNTVKLKPENCVKVTTEKTPLNCGDMKFQSTPQSFKSMKGLTTLKLDNSDVSTNGNSVAMTPKSMIPRLVRKSYSGKSNCSFANSVSNSATKSIYYTPGFPSNQETPIRNARIQSNASRSPSFRDAIAPSI
ncbi:CMGC/RCK protein kinase Mde3 [Schizosaccharomyces japonicus yFS275]|uniref:CMGC/RCK protein kinase Mde3 n=1 Tax=Schizosaccharomyces japonicus (strain yFS275 / FY16936) TaxID=402676 RepID=B6K4J6_SCHJY|nr:CMGC/RCK protein kinase Mde3 [Schizosaccharomyces japonicus yFS275]EEB08403.2 CMGC/RCK protein kinase Mde3 [Schizosaccharomyces japonicus yFS275]